jgi:hypothetical protein
VDEEEVEGTSWMRRKRKDRGIEVVERALASSFCDAYGAFAPLSFIHTHPNDDDEKKTHPS